jgi:hypothetical protein
MEQTIMRKSKPITRNWPSPDELAAVDHGIRELVATLEPMQAERIRQHRERLRPRIQRIMEAIFRARSRAGDCPARAEIRAAHGRAGPREHGSIVFARHRDADRS